MNEVPDSPHHRSRRRVGLIIGAACAVMIAAAAAVVPGIANAAVSTNYQQNWSNGQGSTSFSPNRSNGSYSIRWNNVGDFVAGIGWNPGSTSRTIRYTSNLQNSRGTALISLYGWSTNPLIEYYVIENWSGSPNRAGQNMGTVTSDGGTYTIIKHQQVNQPSIQGNTTFWQYLAIRNSPRSSGTITFSNFVNAWSSHGMRLGSMNYQIMATEGWGGGSGSASINLS
jgi:endo-1,4-beta-xylanase